MIGEKFNFELLYELVGCGHTHMETESAKDIEFLFVKLVLGELAVANLGLDGTHEEWLDVVVLGGHEHASDSRKV